MLFQFNSFNSIFKILPGELSKIVPENPLIDKSLAPKWHILFVRWRLHWSEINLTPEKQKPANTTRTDWIPRWIMFPQDGIILTRVPFASGILQQENKSLEWFILEMYRLFPSTGIIRQNSFKLSNCADIRMRHNEKWHNFISLFHSVSICSSSNILFSNRIYKNTMFSV